MAKKWWDLFNSGRLSYEQVLYNLKRSDLTHEERNALEIMKLAIEEVM